MNRLQLLSERRAVLIDRAARQREEVSALYHRLQQPAGFFDMGYALARRVMTHRTSFAIGLAAVFLLRKKFRISKIAGVMLSAVRIGRYLAKLLPPRK